MFELKTDKVNILGTEYTVKMMPEDYPEFEGDEDGGFCDPWQYRIYIRMMSEDDERTLGEQGTANCYNRIIRHEVMHAYLFESGLGYNTNRSEAWAVNEEMVDWFATQQPKIYQTLKELGAEL